MIDTHTHLYLDDYITDEWPDGGADAVRRAIDAGVEQMIFPNVDCSTVGPMESLAARFPGRIFCAMGLHPTEVDASWATSLADIEYRLASRPERYVAVGEVGVDLYWSDEFRFEQLNVFDRQLTLAEKFDKPVIIHCREALSDTLGVLKQHPGVRAVFHSFGGTVEDVEAIRRLGDHYFGINGIVTFKNSRLGDVLPVIGPDRILLETDAPYLAPVPKRGRRNESAYLPLTAAHVAARLGLTTAEVDEITTRNARRFFGL